MVYIPFRVSATYQFIHWYIYHSGISIMSSQGGIHTTARLNQKVVYIQLRILLVHIPLGLAWVLKVVYIPFRLSRTHQFSHWYIYQSELKQNTSIKWYIYTIVTVDTKVVYLPFWVSPTYQIIHRYIYDSGLQDKEFKKWYIHHY